MLFDTQLNEEVDLLRETVREFAEKEIAPIADEIDPVSYTHLTLPTICSV